MRRLSEYPSEQLPDPRSLVLYTPFPLVTLDEARDERERDAAQGCGKSRRLTARFVVRLAASIALLLILVGLSACTDAKSASSTPAPPEVDVAPVLPRKVQFWDEFTGRISPIHAVEIRPRVTGYIDKVEYVEGAVVNQGDLLFKIDARSYKAAVVSASARLDRAHAIVEVAAGRNARAVSLRKTSAISNEEADDRLSVLRQAQADFIDAEAALEVANLNLAFTDVRAPVRGKVSLATLTAGNLAVADQTLLTTLVSQDPVYVEFDPDEHSYLKYVTESRGSEANLIVKVGLANEEGFPHEGKVSFLDNRLDRATGSIRLRAELDNTNKLFTPGLFARVRVGRETETEALLVEDTAVLTDQDRRYVFVLDRENKAIRKEVKVGRLIEGLRVIETGLVAGERLIINGHQKIFGPGMTVAPVQAAIAKTK